MSTFDHWREHARRWALFGPPLRPVPEEVAFVERAIGDHFSPSKRRHLIVLGVTPELVGARWPPGTQVVAVDRSPEMIGALWPPQNRSVERQVICGDWRALPFLDGSCSAIAGDGSLNALPDRDEAAKLVEEIARVLGRAGRLVLRVYLRPQAPESIETIADDLLARRIATIHVLKWRIAAALHPGDGDGVELDRIWRAWREMAPRAAQMAWSEELIATIDAYRGSRTRYYFPTEKELSELMGSRFLERARVTFGYPLAERCPTLVYDRKSS